MSFLDLFKKKAKTDITTEKVRFLSLFSGIGAPEKALDRLNIEYELVGFSEIDKYATKSYCAVHGVDESMNLGDITKINETKLPKNINLITYGFPCQDISLAGKQKGLFNEDGTQTRSGLFFDALRIIKATQPRMAIAENVKNLTSKKFTEQFKLVLDSLEEVGYNNYWKVLNAKDFGIPQNRERVFIVSIRKDIDDGKFIFPDGFPLEKRLKDMLEDEVDEKFYLDSTKEYFIKHSFESEEKGNGFRFEPHVQKNANIAKTITTRAGGRMDDNFIINIESESDTFKFDSTNKVLVREATKKGYAEAVEGDSINLEQPNSKTRRGRVGKQVAQTLTTSPQQAVVIDEVKRIVSATRKCDIGVTVHDNGDIRPYRLDKKKSGISEMQINKDTNISNTITAGHMPKVYGDSTDLRIRKLTPKECYRLMGFEDADFEKAETVNSNTQLYKQAGNSIVVDVLEALFVNLKPYLKG
jgi:DNA (cytosine-5)-methyltransferase 1